MTGPAYRVRTPRLSLRCWNPEDAPLLLQSVNESIEHLRAWMPWAKSEPVARAALEAYDALGRRLI